MQLTDIHFHNDNYNTLKMRNELIKYVVELRKDGEIDFLLITGDIANKGGPYNCEVKKFLNDIVSAINITKKDVHLIPGNHDLKRGETRTLVIDSILRDSSPSDKLDKLQDETYQTLINAQSDFFTFYKEFLGIDYPSEKLHFVKSSDNYNILSINTCLISDKSGEEGNLLIGKNDFTNLFRNYPPKKIKIN
ncbi:metallophosphoesterase family protein [Virgibacillus pantothenticus]|uniref:metallophosphoesterase family protein n=1 Tax=Virgibacillus pantothenticus TaxID=1473 RepID=UPI0020B43C48|nr:metallophosphoesterase [Virgibacillus pantothenticus]